MSDTPAQNKYISAGEVEYIERGRDNLAPNKKAPPVPWKDLFTSMPFWVRLLLDQSRWNDEPLQIFYLE